MPASARHLLRVTMACLALALFGAAVLTTRKAAMDSPRQGFTFYPPSVYMSSFLACQGDSPCTRTETFPVDPVPKDCCLLLVTNGDGRGDDEVRSYEVFLNGDRVIPSDGSRNAQAPVKVLGSNTLKVTLAGPTHSKIFILIAYDPRKSK